MAELLELRHVGKSYNNDTILSDISLTLHAGTALAITGSSGAGKTTLLSIMGLLQDASTGSVLVNGRALNALDRHAQAKLRGRHFGFVFQRARLINSLTVWENVLVPAWFSGGRADVKQRARDLLARLDMEQRLHYKPQELSLGQLRRVSLARALLLNPPVLLADEPTNDLDPVLAGIVVDCLLQARAAGAGVVIVTHDAALAARADKVLHLQRGQLYEVGPGEPATDNSCRPAAGS